MTDPLTRFSDFTAAVRARLDAGRAEYGDRSFTRPPAELIGELEQEALDLAGWGFVLWARLREMRARLDGAEVEAAVEPRKEGASGTRE